MAKKTQTTEPEPQQQPAPAAKPAQQNPWAVGAALVLTLIIGQVAAYLLAPEAWRAFASRVPVILAMIAFWGPVIALLSAAFVYITLRVLGFSSIEDIRAESVDQNNPAPAIIFVGTLIASILFLTLVIRP